jgi:RNA polymerase sigma-70 factor (ECF subfamily)
MPEETIDLRSVQRRDRRAWALLYDSLVHGTFGLIWNLTGGDRSACEDLNQETWLAAIDSIEDFDPGRGSLKSWVFGIARKKAMDHLRRAYRDPATRHGSPLADQAASKSASTVPPPTVLEADERAALIQAALATLPKERRDVLKSKYIEGRSVKEIAGKFGRTPKAVESMLSRARGELRDLLQWTLD